MRTTIPSIRTRRNRLVALTAAAALSLGLLAGCGSDDASDKDTSKDSDAAALEIDQAWVRATKGSKDTSMTAAYMVLNNTTDEPITVTGASSDVAAMTQIHDMKMDQGKMVMFQLKDGLVLAPETGAILQPGGKHVMLMDMKKELAPGDEVTFTLTYGADQEVTVTAPVKQAAEEEGHYHEPGTGEHGHQG